MNTANQKHIPDSTTQIFQVHVATGVLLDIGGTPGRKQNKAKANCPHKFGDSATNLRRLHNLRSFHLSFRNSTTSGESAIKFWRLHNFQRIRDKVLETPQLIFGVPETTFERKREKVKTQSNDLQKSRDLNQGFSRPQRSFSQRISSERSSHHHWKNDSGYEA
jgi:hypothetical protein